MGLEAEVCKFESAVTVLKEFVCGCVCVRASGGGAEEATSALEVLQELYHIHTTTLTQAAQHGGLLISETAVIKSENKSSSDDDSLPLCESVKYFNRTNKIYNRNEVSSIINCNKTTEKDLIDRKRLRHNEKRNNCAEKKRTNLFVCNVCNKHVRFKKTLEKHILKKHPLISNATSTNCNNNLSRKFSQGNMQMNDYANRSNDRFLSSSLSTANSPGSKVDLKIKEKAVSDRMVYFVNDNVSISAIDTNITLSDVNLRNNTTTIHNVSLCREKSQRVKKPKTSVEASLSEDVKRDVKDYKIELTEKEHKLECDECGNFFTSSKGLKHHKLIHRGEKSYKCDDCGRGFDTSRNLWSHKLIHLNVKHPCVHCGKLYSQKRYLQSHMKTHTEYKKWICSDCGNVFENQRKLQYHRISHKNKEPIVCEDCGQSFTAKSSIKLHRLIHLGIKAYKCTQCDKSFTQAVGLRKHQLTHTGQKLFTCEKCGKTLSDMNSLKYHCMVHEGMKPYRCDRCSKAFITVTKLKKHKKVHLRLGHYQSLEEAGLGKAKRKLTICNPSRLDMN